MIAFSPDKDGPHAVQGLTSSALQEYLDALDSRISEVGIYPVLWRRHTVGARQTSKEGLLWGSTVCSSEAARRQGPMGPCHWNAVLLAAPQVRRTICEHTLRAALPAAAALEPAPEAAGLDAEPNSAAAAAPPPPEELSFLEGLHSLREIGGEHSQQDARLTSLAQHYRWVGVSRMLATANAIRLD